MKMIGAVLALAMLTYAVSVAESESHKFARYIQNWAVGYRDDDGDRLFTGVVSVDADGTTVKIVTNSTTWSALDGDEQNHIKTNAINAVEEAWCLVGHTGLIPGIAVELVDSSGSVLDWKVSGPGLDCK